MSEPIWNKFLTERDKAVFGTSGYGARGGFGKRPALLIIDVNWAFCGDRPEPILESIKRWRNSCGEDAWTALPYIRSLIDKCHDKGVPVMYTTGVRREDNWDTGSWAWKNSRNEEDRETIVTNLDGNEIVDADRAGATGHRGAQAKAVRLLRHQHGELSDAARLRQPDRHRHDHVGLRARHRARCVSASITASRSPRKAASTARRRATPSICAT